jgi:hypothetical protein
MLGATLIVELLLPNRQYQIRNGYSFFWPIAAAEAELMKTLNGIMANTSNVVMDARPKRTVLYKHTEASCVSIKTRLIFHSSKQ